MAAAKENGVSSGFGSLSALGDLFLVCFGILKPEQGHLILPERGNPPKRVGEGISETEQGSEGSGGGSRTPHNPPLPGKCAKSFLPPEPVVTGSIC